MNSQVHLQTSSPTNITLYAFFYIRARWSFCTRWAFRFRRYIKNMTVFWDVASCSLVQTAVSELLCWYVTKPGKISLHINYKKPHGKYDIGKLHRAFHTSCSNGSSLTAIKSKVNLEFVRQPCCSSFYKSITSGIAGRLHTFYCMHCDCCNLITLPTLC